MLPKANRLRRPAEFDRAVRQGRRAASKTLVVHASRNSPFPPRVGFVVSKAVGNAVQ
nr:ribonuclease P protein component [Nocardioidaceae bacterium]